MTVYKNHMTITVPKDWMPLIREGGIASESFYAGLTALRRANYAQTSLYSHAFFGITIGLERMCKLAILLDSRAAPGGKYPSDAEFRNKYGHDLVKLFAAVDAFGNRSATTSGSCSHTKTFHVQR